MTIYCVVSVTPNIPTIELESEDRVVPGVYAVTFEAGDVDYQRNDGDGDPIIETAKDIFHAAIAIGNLDDFEIDFATVEQSAGVPADAHWLTAADSVLPKLLG
jgi:hypothetical protein